MRCPVMYVCHVRFRCALQYQKYTTLMYSPGLAPLLDSLDRLRCTHKTHASQVGGVRSDNGSSRGTLPAQLHIRLTLTYCSLGA